LEHHLEVEEIMKASSRKIGKNSSAKKWQLFERLVTAIHHAESHGAKVVWNDKINRRQFDVTVRFQYGMYSYLTVVECRDYGKSLSVDKIDAFVTKSRDAKAHKAIMVSSSGYQGGCIDVAKKHNIELFTLEKINQIPESFLRAKFTPALNIYDICLHSKNNDFILPQKRNVLPYLMKHVLVQYEEKILPIDELVSLHADHIMRNIDENARDFEIILSSDFKTEIPNLGVDINATSVTFKYRIIPARIIENSTLDPYISERLSQGYEYRDAIQGTKRVFSSFDLNLGLDTLLEPGKFYINPTLDFCYYCRGIKNNIVVMLLLESYQHGNLMQAEFSMDIEVANKLVEITDNTEIERLKKILLKLEKVQKP
jgi:hypothetical protein